MSKIFEFENQLLLRVPPTVAEKLNAALSTEQTEEAPPTLELTPFFALDDENSESLRFKFKFGDFSSFGTLVDLPTITESAKSLDFINFFKSNDVTQMVYVHPNGETALDKCKDWRTVAKKAISKTEPRIMHYLARDGVTPPTKCVRKRYYRKRPNVSKPLTREVEKEMITIKSELCKHRESTIERMEAQGDGSMARPRARRKL